MPRFGKKINKKFCWEIFYDWGIFSSGDTSNLGSNSMQQFPLMARKYLSLMLKHESKGSLNIISGISNFRFYDGNY